MVIINKLECPVDIKLGAHAYTHVSFIGMSEHPHHVVVERKLTRHM